MSQENDLLQAELSQSNKNVENNNNVAAEMSTLTALMCVASMSPNGKKLIDGATEEVINDFLDTYGKVRFIY